ncbi:hypothetical protein Sste5346_006477 [Sporothrix stenoceras]|uniref:Uncharacterized protein n=1 Tax=Sporothrix stenoceras TaxID=5173 RepID=A0ABR3YZ06_9PEZI
MVAAGSPDSLAAILTTSPSSSSAAQKRHQSPIRSYGALAFLNFFFHRVTRSGPKLLLYLALLLTSLLVLTQCLPSSVSNQIVSSTSHLWEFRPSGLGGSGGSSKTKPIPSPGDNNAHDALAGGGLRVVVFGENDIATSVQPDTANPLAGNGTSWTRELCIDLGCTTYISYVPVLESPRRSLSSNPLYGAATDEVVRDSKEKGPADDFTYVSEQYPIPWEAPDLYTQVSKFLEQPAPQRPPKETVWVLVSGMWDVWSLAAFPSKTAESYLTSMVFDLISAIEMLYDASHDVKSIAYSNYNAITLDDDIIIASGNQTANINNPEGATSQKSGLKWDDSNFEPFRVVIPLLFDPSLVPGWHLNRPNAPALHTKPEQLRNAVRLTKRWNDYVMEEMNNWMKKNVTFIHPGDREKFDPNAAAAAAAPPAAEAKPATESKAKVPNKLAPMGGAPKGALPNISAKQRRDNSRPNVPTLLRDGILFRMSDYLMDMIIDGQMRMRGIVDKKGFGKLPKDTSFLEVHRPCMAPEFVGLPTESNIKTEKIQFQYEEDEKHHKTALKGVDDPTHTLVAPGPPTGTEKVNDDPTHTHVEPGPPTGTEQPEHNHNPSLSHAKSRYRSKAKAKREEVPWKGPPVPPALPAVSQPQTPPTSPKLLVCEEPDRHLFYTPFSLGVRAIEDIGRLAASVVRASPKTRSAWEMDRHNSIENDRQPASWKEYYHS